MRRKMIPPMPEANGPEHDRFKRFAKAVLADPKSEVATWKELLAHLKAERREIENRTAEMRKTLAKSKQSTPAVH
jgi:hypothetical protein